MIIKLTETWDDKVEKAIAIAKEHNIGVEFIRDGEHGTEDLNVVAKFQNAGFKHQISCYQSEYDKNAIKVMFWIDE